MGLGEAKNPILGWRTVASRRRNFLAERSWDEQVADLQQLEETSRIGGSKHSPPATRPSSGWQLRGQLPYDGAASGRLFFFHTAGVAGLFGFFFLPATGKKMFH